MLLMQMSGDSCVPCNAETGRKPGSKGCCSAASRAFFKIFLPRWMSALVICAVVMMSRFREEADPQRPEVGPQVGKVLKRSAKTRPSGWLKPSRSRFVGITLEGEGAAQLPKHRGHQRIPSLRNEAFTSKPFIAAFICH